MTHLFGNAAFQLVHEPPHRVARTAVVAATHLGGCGACCAFTGTTKSRTAGPT